MGSTQFATGEDVHISNSQSGYRVEVLVAQSGERHALVVSRSLGQPLFRPSVWLTSLRRPRGVAAGTLANNAQTIASVYSWAEACDLSIDERFRLGHFLSQWEVADLAEYLRIEIRTLLPTTKIRRFRSTEPAREPSHKAVVTPAVANYRLDMAANYLNWLATDAIHRMHNAGSPREAREAEGSRDTMLLRLRGHKQIAKGRNSLTLRMAPEPEVISHLLCVVREDHPKNPWADPPRLLSVLKAAQATENTQEVERIQAMLKSKLAIRLRNRLVVHLLYYLGLRRGEMLGLKVRDLKGQDLFVLRHPDDPEDPRKHQPQVKTRERKLIVSSGLQAALLDYVSLVRSSILGARKHPFLVVNHRDGSPLSFSGLARIFHSLRTVEGLPNNLTPHHLRHAFHEEFSRLADEQGLDPAREVQIRAELGGWNPHTKTPTAEIYLRRKTKRKAQEILLQLQEDMVHPSRVDHE